MKKIISTAFILLVITTISCKKNEIIKYQEKPAVYFSNMPDGDSLVYSFIGKNVTIDTLYLDIKLLGDNLPSAKKI